MTDYQSSLALLLPSAVCSLRFWAFPLPLTDWPIPSGDNRAILLFAFHTQFSASLGSLVALQTPVFEPNSNHQPFRAFSETLLPAHTEIEITRATEYTNSDRNRETETVTHPFSNQNQPFSTTFIHFSTPSSYLIPRNPFWTLQHILLQIIPISNRTRHWGLVFERYCVF